MATQVTKWQSENGLLFESEAEAIQEDKTSEFRDWCSMNICCGGEHWTSSMVATAILEEWEMVRKQKPAQVDAALFEARFDDEPQQGWVLPKWPD